MIRKHTRKLVLGMAIGVGMAVSCSTDDQSEDAEADCLDKVWEVRSSCPAQCTYAIVYGPEEENSTTIDTNEATFDYYEELVLNSGQPVCWEGEK